MAQGKQVILKCECRDNGESDLWTLVLRPLHDLHQVLDHDHLSMPALRTCCSVAVFYGLDCFIDDISACGATGPGLHTLIVCVGASILLPIPSSK